MPGVPFDEQKNVIANKDGRIHDNGKILKGLYVTGWIKRGPTGVLGTNKPCSAKTVTSLLDDISSLPRCKTPSTSLLVDLLKERNIRVITYEDWEKIDEIEVKQGKTYQKPREKLTRLTEILSSLDKLRVL